MTAVDVAGCDATAWVRRNRLPRRVRLARNTERAGAACRAEGDALEHAHLRLAVHTHGVIWSQWRQQCMQSLENLLRKLWGGPGYQCIDIVDGHARCSGFGHGGNLPDTPGCGHAAANNQAETSPAAVHDRPGTMPPMSTLTRTALVDVDWLHAHVDEVRVVDTRQTGAYLAGHVPGACSFPLDSLLIERTTREALELLGRAAQAALAARGIGPRDHIVLVDDGDGSAALGALMCELAGAAWVTVLDSGVTLWGSAGHAVASFPSLPDASNVADWSDVAPDLSHLATFDELVAATTDEQTLVLDTRSQLEHEGILGTPCCARRGAIPGATHLEWTSFFDMSGRAHSGERLHVLLGLVGAQVDTPIIVSCHAGHRSAVAARVLWAAGWTNVRVSLGSWHEWAARAAASGPHTS
ncbi:MAG: rhdA 1 [Thermoleophilia bacterium]|nr:rhdA 1 [Thermoleophilia bacterium]